VLLGDRLHDRGVKRLVLVDSDVAKFHGDGTATNPVSLYYLAANENAAFTAVYSFYYTKVSSIALTDGK
jgi:hypothetical protein